MRGFTRRHPGVPQELRGTYAGLAHPAAVEHLVSLGVSAVELLPVHHFVTEPDVAARGLTNYWGYNTVGYFAPHAAYAACGPAGRGAQVGEFKAMVKALHAAGLEVILDVVYNHTGEGGQDGPTLAFRGIDNAAYYRLRDGGRRYEDYTGCGNTLDVSHPHVLQLVMDSLRYWVLEMHVDGFRFDLAAALARSMHDVDMLGGFLTTIGQDPVLSRVKLIAEPWDVGQGGYQVGEFPPLWSEWNDKYRNTVRDFWRGVRRRSCATWATGCPGRPTCTATTAAVRSRRSTSSRRTTASRCATWCRTTTSTTRTTARTTGTAPTTTAAGTTASRARPTTRPCWPSGAARCATC